MRCRTRRLPRLNREGMLRPAHTGGQHLKHAGPEALDSLADLLDEIRRHAGLREPKCGTFYFRSSGLLHFHEDPAGMFADLKVDGEYQRFRVNTVPERRALVQRVARLTREPGRRR